MSEDKRNPIEESDSVWIYPSKALRIHNRHRKEGKKRDMSGCGFCEKGLDAVASYRKKEPREDAVAESRGTDEKRRTPLSLNYWLMDEEESKDKV